MSVISNEYILRFKLTIYNSIAMQYFNSINNLCDKISDYIFIEFNLFFL